MRSIHSPFCPTTFLPFTKAFSTVATDSGDSFSSSVPASYTSRSLRTFRALRTLRARRPSDASSLRFYFLFGGDRANSRRVVRQALRPVFARSLPSCSIAFNFRPAGVALRHPRLAAPSLDYSRRLRQGALLEREVIVSGASSGARDLPLSVFPQLLADANNALTGLGRRSFTSNPGEPHFVFSSSSSPLQLRLLGVTFPQISSTTRRRSAEAGSLTKAVSPLSLTGASSVALGAAKVVDSTIITLLAQREASTFNSVGVCLAPPIPFISLLSLLARRCHFLRVSKLFCFDSMVQRPCSRTANLRESGSIPLRVFFWGHSSVGRANALQALGHRFNSDCLHNFFMLYALLKDRRRRLLHSLYERRRLLLRSLRENRSLPSRLRSQAFRALTLLPRDSSRTRRRNRCTLTGRSRAIVRRFGVSRLRFRLLAREGRLAGVKKASW